MRRLEDVLGIKRKYQIEILNIGSTLKILAKGAETEKSNIVGVGIGQKLIKRKPSDELSIVISVIKKEYDESRLTDTEAIPKEYDGIKTDVIETGILRAQSDQINLLRMHPVECGSSIGHYNITAGTLGCLVRKENETYILSNNHILADCNRGNIGDAILHPGPADGGTLEDKIAELSFFEKVSIGTGINKIDAALAKPLDDKQINPNIIGIGKPTGTIKAELGMEIIKSGRTTNVTTGRISVLDYTCHINFDNGDTALFDNQLMSWKMSAGGDSGSVVLAKDENRKICGLLFAGSPVSTVINPIENVFDILGIESVYY